MPAQFERRTEGYKGVESKALLPLYHQGNTHKVVHHVALLDMLHVGAGLKECLPVVGGQHGVALKVIEHLSYGYRRGQNQRTTQAEAHTGKRYAPLP